MLKIFKMINIQKRTLIFSLLSLLSLLISYLVVVKVKRSAPEKMPNNKIAVREPAVAGSFYPSDKKELDNLLQSLLDKTPVATKEGKLAILIVPHAGIEFSGEVAAAGFRQIAQEDFSRVIILGPSHHYLFDYAAVYNKGAWQTPLGVVDIDEDLASKTIDDQQKILADQAPHQAEHSLEIELIFLQKVLKNFKIVPILISQLDDNLSFSLAKKITDSLDDKTLLVISSDLSHYPSWETANKVDGETIKAILSGKAEFFTQTIKQQIAKNYPNLDTCACGEKAIEVGLKVAEILSTADFKKIKYENSGDIIGDKSRVVGYGAIGGFRKSPAITQTLDEKAQNEALTIARESLENYFSGKGKISTPPSSPTLEQPLGAFVTLRIGGELRGCIGSFEPKEPLSKVIQEMAIAAATQDYRFPPVQKEELPEIKIEISVMTPKKKIDNWRGIVLGKHGVVVQKGNRSGTFLPQVATETGWSLEEFLSQLCLQKAGLPANCYKDPSTNLYTFEAQVFAEKQNP